MTTNTGPRRTSSTNGDAPAAQSGAPARDRSYPTREVVIRARSPRGFLVTITLRDVRLADVEETENRLMDEGYRPED